MEGFVSSGEFSQRNLFLITSHNSDDGFVQALFSSFLNRSLAQGDLTQPEIDGWVKALPVVGRAGVAQGFLASNEFRTDVVRSFYGDPTLTPVPFLPLLPYVLHRTSPPAATEISGWLSLGFDLLTTEVGFAGSAEFFAGG
jgi:hypothetical protein